MSKMTAVQWLVEQINPYGVSVHQDLFEQALQMERKQIQNAHVNGNKEYTIGGGYELIAEHYYNETYGVLKMKAEIIQAQREIIQGYYNRIVMQQPDLETIIQWIEDDLQTIRMDDIVLDAENIINAPKDPHEVSKVKCDVCNYGWVAVRPLGLTKLECPQCGGLCSFENET